MSCSWSSVETSTNTTSDSARSQETESCQERRMRKWSGMGEVSNEVMTRDPPVGAPFTGMMLGLYAFGELERCLVPADFRYAELH